jgi:transposase
MKKNLTFLTVFLFCISCATPTVVNVIGPNDNEMNCKELSAEILKANQYADEAQEAKKSGKPHNIGAILFFLPGYGVTLSNIEEATKAAKERAIHLNKLKGEKEC